LSRHLFAAIAALCISPNLFAAADAAKPAAPAAAAADAPPPEQAQLDFFLGNWSCNGQTFASEMGPEHKTSAVVHAAKSVGDRWLHLAYDEKKTEVNPIPYHAGVYMGYDAGMKQFVESCVDNFGGYCTQSGKGWDGDKLVFDGTAKGSGQTFTVRDTFTKHGAAQLTHTGEMQGPDKQWAKTDEETCKKG
jgi:hypothetical protein